MSAEQQQAAAPTQEDEAAGNGHTPLTEALGGLEWRCVGPHRGGRVVAVAGDPVNPMVFYFGACAGGVWKTTDGGTYWENVSDGFFKTAAVGAIAVSESDPNVIYVGMGETTIRGDVSHGDGVYKSTDAGKTWTHLGLEDTRHIAKIRIHPQNPDLVYVAALGHAYGPNKERGVYRSKNGGKTWEQILFRSEKAGAIDLSMDPHNPRILYASCWEAQRRPYRLDSGGPGSSLYKSTDGGDTWVELTDKEGLPKGIKGKIGLAVSPAKPDRVWALVEARDGALFRSDDGGETWQRLSEEGGLRWRAWYYMHVFADPQDPDTCWVLNLKCWKSVDGGKTFTEVPTPHGDNHDLWFDPHNPQRMIEGNDGGACVSFNGGVAWSTLWNQPTAQFYHVTTDTQVPYRLYGSQQDNSAISVPHMSINGAVGETEWFVPGGGESGYIAVRPDNPDIIFGGAIGSGPGNGYLLRYDGKTKQERNITVWPDVQGMGDGAGSLKYRFQWTFPILISPHDPNVLYVAANHLLRSTDEGGSWEVVSPDLTRNDPSKLQPSGGPITRDNTGAEVYCTIFAFLESPHEKGLFWAGTDDGLVHLSRDGGATWEEVTPPDLKTPEGEWALISVIEQSPHDPATVYLAATRYKHDDWKPYLYKTNDYGKTWQKITNGIPENDFTRVIREDPECRGLLYAGTETGIYVSFDDGASWNRLQGNLPVVPIHDFVIKDRDLVVATHGRSFWILDDVTPLHQIKEQQDSANAQLFKPRPTTKFQVLGWWWLFAQPSEYINYGSAGPIGMAFKARRKPDGNVDLKLLDAGQNPPHGVIITYYLPQRPEGEITLTILEEGGKEIRQFTSKKPPEKDQVAAPERTPAEETLLAAGAEGLEAQPPEGSGDEDKPDATEPIVPKEAGLNRFVWNFRLPSPHKVPGDKTTEEFLIGPSVPPGLYQVQLKVGDQTDTQPIEIVKDPRVTTSQEDLQAQFDLLVQISDKLSATHDTINDIREVKGQVEAWEKRLKKHDNKELTDAAASLKKSLTSIEEALIQVRGDSPLQYPSRLNEKLASLIFAVDFVDCPPTQQAREVFDDLSAKIDHQLEQWEHVLQRDVAAFNQKIQQASIPVIGPAPRKEEGKEAVSVG